MIALEAPLRSNLYIAKSGKFSNWFYTQTVFCFYKVRKMELAKIPDQQ